MNFKQKDFSKTLIEDYYNNFNEDGRLETRHGQVEFATGIKYIEEVLKGDKTKTILDIGAGTGKYSCHFDSLGYKVTAVELVERNIEVFKSKGSNVNIIKGNALDLSFIKDKSFDVTLVFGPMYHLFTREDKLKALNEAKRVTKDGGYILVNYLMNDYSVIMYAFVKGHIKDALEEGRLDSNYHIVYKEDDLYSMVRIEDIDSFNHEVGLNREKIIALDGASDYIRSALTRLSEEDFKEFIKYHFSICERSDLLGASSHLLDIIKK